MPKRQLTPITKGERSAERADRATRQLMTTFRSNERDMPKRPPRTKTTTKGQTTVAKVDPELIARYFARTKRDANAQTRYAPPIINHRLCK